MTRGNESFFFRYRHIIAVILVSASIFVFVKESATPYTRSDPRASLALTQEILTHGSIKMDRYRDHGYGYVIIGHNGHSYYYFPLGSSISAIPFVWYEIVVRDRDMSNISHESRAQKHIAAVLSAFIFILLYLIARNRLDPTPAILTAVVFWLGTSLSSTLGQALWSHDFGVFYTLASILLAFEITEKDRRHAWFFLGLTLFMAYLSRPTLALLPIAILLYLSLNRKWNDAVKTGATAAALLLMFVAFSYHEFNIPLPPYYMPGRLGDSAFWTALYGNLLSPSRGLLVFSPFLLVFLLRYKTTGAVLASEKTLLPFVGWIVLHLIAISQYPHWWAGGSYGPRLMTDVLPALFVLFTALAARELHRGVSITSPAIVFLIITIPVSIYFNSVQGLYNSYASFLWNTSPSIDTHNKYLFDWRYPQFLHTRKRHEERRTDLVASNRSSYEATVANFPQIMPGENIPYNSPKALFVGWGDPEAGYRWSSNLRVDIFTAGVKHIDRLKGVIVLRTRTFGKQNLSLTVNDQAVINREIEQNTFGEMRFTFDPGILHTDRMNTLTFTLPDARTPGNLDVRELALAIKSFRFE